ncbi:MAG: hypothetical protein MUF58_24255 [Arcicella sp.]|nr:hypothetical protein [Arcicella sp.]
MPKSTAMILRGASIIAFLLVSEVKAQFISFNEPNRREFKNTPPSNFSVYLSEEEKNPLNFTVKISNPTQETVRAYLRNRNGFNFLDEKQLSKESKIAMKLNLALLEDGEYTFVIRTANHFFIKHFNLQSGDLMTTRINGREVMTTNRSVVLQDE